MLRVLSIGIAVFNAVVWRALRLLAHCPPFSTGLPTVGPIISALNITAHMFTAYIIGAEGSLLIYHLYQTKLRTGLVCCLFSRSRSTEAQLPCLCDKQAVGVLKWAQIRFLTQNQVCAGSNDCRL